MSVHIHKATVKNKEVIIYIGWDNPLQQFFLTIEYANEEDYVEDDPMGRFVYSNLSDKNLVIGDIKQQSLDYFKKILDDFEIVIPDQTFDILYRDKFYEKLIVN